MSRQRLVVVLASALFVGLIEALSDTLLDPVLPFPFDAILITIAVFFVVLAVSGAAYRRIDRLGAALAARNRDLETRAASAAALHRVSVAIAALADVRQVLDAVVENARTLLAADAAVLLLNGPDGRLVHAASSGPGEAIDRAGGRSPAAAVATPAAALPERRAADAPPANADPDADAVLRFIDPALAVGRLTVPLRRGGETVGVLAVTSKRPRSFTADDLETVASLANQATIAVENARLQARLRDLAVETERERIAREMHDGLAQVLGYVSTKSQAVEELLAVDRVDDARGQLQQLTAAARSIYVDVREAILGLRSPITPELGLVGAIERYAARFAEASKLGVVVEAAPAARTLELAPECEAQVFRIVQESLTNVRKHADAGRVVIHVDQEQDAFVVELDDDGRGFVGEPGASVTGWPTYGLTAMRERAASIGATLTWANRPTGGARVRLAVPLHAVAVAADGTR